MKSFRTTSFFKALIVSPTKLWLVCLIVFLFTNGCQKNNTKTDEVRSAKFVDYILSYTSGVISVTDPIRVKFNTRQNDTIIGRSIDQKILSFIPNVEGNSYWEDQHTLLFQPDHSLIAGKTYKVSVNLKTLFPKIDDERKKFSFNFQTLVQNFELSFGGIQLYNSSELNRIKLEGQLQTADVTELPKIKQMLAATQDGKPLSINWEMKDKKNYNFIIENVRRTEVSGKVNLKINGMPIGVKRSENQTLDVPSLKDYKIVSAKFVNGEDAHISVVFSDPLDGSQDLTGLINLSNQKINLRYVINLNELKIYPSREVYGSSDLQINAGVKSITGSRLEEDFLKKIQFTQLKPSVKFLSKNSKSIMPSTQGLYLPFQAVSLKAVDVQIVKVFNTNVLQYLQVNSIGDEQQLHRVGKPVFRKTINLETIGVTDLYKWNNFTVDISDLVGKDPGAIYQVNISFRKSQSLYSCGGENSQNSDLEEIDDTWDVEEEASFWDNYEYYYPPGYQWEDRNNPCTISYYGRQKMISKTFFASDLGIIAKKREGGNLHVYVTDLKTTNPIEGVEVQLFDYQQQALVSGNTDNTGYVSFKSPDNPYFVVAKKGNQVGYLKLDNGSSLSVSNFNVSGSKIKNGLKGFLYGERGVWRPADTVHLCLIVQDKNTIKVPEDHPVILEFYNPSGQLTSRKVNSSPVGNMYRFDLITKKDAPTGNWKAKAKVGGSEFYKQVKIETIKPNRLKMSLDFRKEKFTSADHVLAGDLNVRWLTGATASNLKVEYELMLKPVKTIFTNFPSFNFDDVSKDFFSERKLAYSGKTDKNGLAHISIDMGRINNSPGSLVAHLFGKVYEKGGDFSIQNISIPYFPYTSFVGLKVPEGDKRGMLLTDQDHDIQIASVDANGNPVSRNELEVKVFKLNWRWWWDNSYDNISNYVGTSYRRPVQISNAKTVNGKGIWKLKINYPQWGRYYIQIKDPVSGHSSGQVVYVDWPGWAGKVNRGGMDGAAMLDYSTDKSEYQVGDPVHITLPSTKGNRVLVSLETGSQVVNSFWVETTNKSTDITFNTDQTMTPNVYVSLTMIQPHGQKLNDLPIRLYGYKSISIKDPKTILQPILKVPSEIRPEQNYSITVSESKGRAMTYTLAVVDEGLLDITNFKTPDPWSTFFAREALGIKSWDVYDQVMGAYNGQFQHILAIGGDEELKPREDNNANRFKPVVEFLGPFMLQKGQSNTHKLKMAQYIGSVKTMVVASSETAFGHSDKVTPVKQSLMILATLPRVAGPGEEMMLPVNVFTLSDDVKNVSLKVKTNNLFSLPDGNTQTLRFDKQGDQVVFFKLQARQTLGVGKVSVEANSGKISASYDVEMNIMARNPETTKVNETLLEAGKKWSIDYVPLGLPGKNMGVVEVSTLPPLNLQQRTRYLISYPHGCIEQTISSVFAQLYLDKLMDLSIEQKKQVQFNVKEGINRLKSFQLTDGGFSYWPGKQFANLWGTNYAGHFLIEARKRGYALPPGMIDNWIAFQKTKANGWTTGNSDDNDDLTQAYRLFTLALADEPILGAMNRLKQYQTLTLRAKWRLALAYSVAGYPQQANEIISNSKMIKDQGTNYRYTFGSFTRDQAMVLETLTSLDRKTEAFELLAEISKPLGDPNRWLSTQTAAYCLVSISKYVEHFKLNENSNLQVSIDGTSTTVENNYYVDQVSIKEPDKNSSISIVNKGEGSVFIRLIRTGVPIEGTEKPSEHNIKLDILYLDEANQPVHYEKLKQGTNFKAVVTIGNPGTLGIYNHIALTQVFPSGWEIINTRLDGSSQQTNANYVDIRDDRVMHYFDLKPGKSVQFKVLLNAAYLGKYYLPATSVGTMYNNSVYANSSGQWVTIDK